MLYLITSYLKFLLRSTNQHGVHSPFMYDLITRCFYDKTVYPEYTLLKEYRNSRYNSKESIEITEFGEGSRVFSSNTRKISAIAKNAGISAKRQKLLFRLCQYLNPETVLELGTSLGMATAAMSLGAPNATIDTVEGCVNIAKQAQYGFDAFKLKNIRLHTHSFQDYFKNLKQDSYDLVFIDGSHNKLSTIEVFNELLQFKNDRSVFIFDDIYWSPQMTEAWREIIKHSEVSISMDCFYWGLVFFKPAFDAAKIAQQKQHFTIRL